MLITRLATYQSFTVSREYVLPPTAENGMSGALDLGAKQLRRLVVVSK